MLLIFLFNVVGVVIYFLLGLFLLGLFLSVELLLEKRGLLAELLISLENDFPKVFLTWMLSSGYLVWTYSGE